MPEDIVYSLCQKALEKSSSSQMIRMADEEKKMVLLKTHFLKTVQLSSWDEVLRQYPSYADEESLSAFKGTCHMDDVILKQQLFIPDMPSSSNEQPRNTVLYVNFLLFSAKVMKRNSYETRFFFF